MCRYSIRTNEWRYVEWRDWNGATLSARWDKAPVAVELYGHGNDSVLSGFATERMNMINSSRTQGVRSQLSALVRELFDLSGSV